MTQDGGARIYWTARQMPMLAALRSRFEASRPLQGHRIGVCLHVEPKTAVMCETLRAGGADVAVTGSPGTTQDDVAEALGERGCTVFTRSTDGGGEHQANIAAVIDWGPGMLLDNGADLLFHASRSGTLHQLIGGTEETTTGANRLREDLAEPPPFPVLVINDSPLKLIVENEHGVGQSVVQAFMQRTNLMLPGRACVVIGYGWCGRGIARTLRSLGARVSVVETDEIRALEAGMDGMSVRTLDEALPPGEAFFTVTGRPGILGRHGFERMRAGAGLTRPPPVKTGVQISPPSKFPYPDLSQNPAVFCNI